MKRIFFLTVLVVGLSAFVLVEHMEAQGFVVRISPAPLGNFSISAPPLTSPVITSNKINISPSGLNSLKLRTIDMTGLERLQSIEKVEIRATPQIEITPKSGKIILRKGKDTHSVGRVIMVPPTPPEPPKGNGGGGGDSANEDEICFYDSTGKLIFCTKVTE